MEPRIGAEITKKRPCVIVSSDALHKVAVRIVVPITGKDHGKPDPRYHVPVAVDDVEKWEAEGLSKDSFADTLQIRCASLSRFGNYIAKMKPDVLEEIVNKVAAIIEV